MGMDPRDFQHFKQQDYEFEVWIENWDTVEIFCSMATQWRVNPFGGVAGLDYGALNSVMDIMQVRDKRDVFASIRVMEATALPVLNKPTEKAHGRKKV